MNDAEKSRLIALAVGWTAKFYKSLDCCLWKSPDGTEQAEHPNYMTDDAAAIRDVLPKFHPWRLKDVGACDGPEFKGLIGPDLFRGDGQTISAAICNAYAASLGGWNALMEKYDD